MPDYRIYRVNDAGKILSALDFKAESDADACQQAVKMRSATAVEIWEGTRVVGKLDGRPPLV